MPFLLAETVSQALTDKLKNHGLPMKKMKTQIIIIGIVYRELFGYETSQLSLEIGYKKFIRNEERDGK